MFPLKSSDISCSDDMKAYGFKPKFGGWIMFHNGKSIFCECFLSSNSETLQLGLIKLYQEVFLSLSLSFFSGSPLHGDIGH